MSTTDTPASTPSSLSPVKRDPRPAAPPPVRRGPNRRLRYVLAAGCAAAVIWSMWGTHVGLASLIEGRAGAARLISGLFPPDLDGTLLSRVGTAVAQTIQISIAALVLGALIGLPLAILMAANVNAPGWLSGTARSIATGLRGVPELLWGLLFVATVGLGPAAGVYAISLHAAGLLGKLCSEQLEAVDPAPVEAMRLTGAGRAATALLAIFPQARANIASQLLYLWECNIRSSVVIGFVGAGGIGQALGIAMKLFRYQEMATLLIAVLVLVIGVDRISRAFRGRLGAASHKTNRSLIRQLTFWRK